MIQDHIDYNQTHTFLTGHFLGQRASNPLGNIDQRGQATNQGRNGRRRQIGSRVASDFHEFFAIPIGNLPTVSNPMTDVTNRNSIRWSGGSSPE